MYAMQTSLATGRKLGFLLMLLCCQSIPAQVWVKGKVMDAASKQPLEAVSVIVTGDTKKQLTHTEADGKFSLQLPDTKNAIILSLIGYRSQTVIIDTSKELSIALERKLVDLTEVVVMQQNHSEKFNTLSRVDLDLNPVRSSQELLRVVPGLFVAQHAGGGKAEQIFLRGFDCDHGTDIAVSVDGMPVNMVSHAHGQGYADAHFIIPETINTVDFGTGPYYTQQGNLNTAGYVGFSTWNNIQGSRIQLEAGNFQTFRSLLMLDLLHRDKEKQGAYLAGEYYGTNGPTLSPQHFKRYNLFGKYNLALSEQTQLNASLSAFSSSWDASGQVPERAVYNGNIDRFGSIDPSEGGNTERYNTTLAVTHRFTPNTRWENRAYAAKYRFNLYSNFTFFLNDPVNGDEILQAESRNLYGFSSKLTIAHPFRNWTWTAIYGTGLRFDATTDSRLTHVVKRQFLNDVARGDITEENLYAYVQEQVSVGRWILDAGLRLDHLSFEYYDKMNPVQSPAQQKTILSPKINLQYALNRDLQVYLKAGKGFHSNDTRVVVKNRGKEILPAAYGFDLGMILKPVPKLLLNMAAWYLEMAQEFVYVGDEAVTEPSGRTVRTGIDLQARYQLTEHWFANLNLNATKARFRDEPKGLDHIPLAPTLSCTGGFFYKTIEGWNGGISWRYLQNRPANEDNTITAKGYFVSDVTLTYTRKQYEIGLAIENLFNTKWNEAQFATSSRLQNEPAPVTELHFTPGTPFFAKIKLAYLF